jgi:secreted trypsin-like serine protease
MSYPRQAFTRKAAAFAATLLAFSTSIAGIYRHDVPEKKYLQLGRQKQFDCVGQLAKADSAGRITLGASCVLVGDRYVLSAAHCFIDNDFRADTLDTLIDGKKAQMVFNSPINYRVTDFSKRYVAFGKRRIKVKRGIIYPAYLDSLTRGSCDLALLELEQAVTAIKPAKMSRTFDELHGDVTGVGYGASGRADELESVYLHNRKIAGQSVVDSLGGPEIESHQTQLFCEFVAPGDQAAMHTCRPLEYICSGGDSGGGLFRQTEAGWELIGICSGGDVNLPLLLSRKSYYGQSMSWTRVSTFVSWIEDQMK